jgi:hypothetical protein
MSYGEVFAADRNEYGVRVARKPSQREVLEAESLRIAEQLAKIARFGDDVYEDDTVLAFDYQFNGGSKVYSYAIIKCAGRWYTTGTKVNGGQTWDQLVRFWTQGTVVNMWVAAEWEQVL